MWQIWKLRRALRVCESVWMSSYWSDSIGRPPSYLEKVYLSLNICQEKWWLLSVTFYWEGKKNLYDSWFLLRVIYLLLGLFLHHCRCVSWFTCETDRLKYICKNMSHIHPHINESFILSTIYIMYFNKSPETEHKFCPGRQNKQNSCYISVPPWLVTFKPQPCLHVASQTH